MTTDTVTAATDPKPARPTPIAIVGIGCWYPGARNPRELWANVLGRRRQFRRMPDVRLPLAEYQHDDRRAPDKTYGIQAAVLDGYRFDWAGRRIPKTTYESTDVAHWLALDVALQMLEDAGYRPADLPRETTRVVVGNTLTGEFTRSNGLRIRWPFVEKTLRAAASSLGMRPEALAALTRSMERTFKSVFAPVNEDTLAGGLANTIAGRICNYLDVHGGGFIVDGACSSSLLAVYSAAEALAGGAADFAIAGGVDVSLDPFELIGFAKTGALTPTEMSVYDRRGNGFIPGEGCGFLGLKRLADAERDGDKVYAVLDGWAMSSDGKGGLTAPSVGGQALALRRAYEMAGVDPRSVDFVEGHGTGTAVGDRTELLAIARALSAEGDAGRRRCGVTSFKSIAGHTKAAAGVGALIKATIAVNQRVLPPTAGCTQPHDVFDGDSASLYPILRGEVRPPEEPVRAGVSAMGFGGINVHVTLRSGERRVDALRPDVDERAAMASAQDAEVLCLSAATVPELVARAEALASDAAGASLAELADLAAARNPESDPRLPLKAAVLADSPATLVRRLRGLVERLGSGAQGNPGLVDRKEGLLVRQGRDRCAYGFVFPGQGAQRAGVARALLERFDWARALVDDADRWAREVGTEGLALAMYPDADRRVGKDERDEAARRLRDTRLAQPAIAVGSLLWLRWLERLGIRPAAAMGHSLGELTAFHAAGAFDERTLVQLATIRGQLMAGGDAAPTGGMTSLACDREAADGLVREAASGAALVVANVNGPSQTVVSGELGAIAALEEAARRRGIAAHRLAVSNAFHSPLVASAAARLRESTVVPRSPARLDGVLVSSSDGRRVAAGIDLREHFADQIVRPVDFVGAVRSMADHCDVMVEVGPGGTLSNLAGQIRGHGVPAWPVERTPESFEDLSWVVGVAHVHGTRIAWDELYARRVLRPFVPAKDLSFIVNPCERPLDVAGAAGVDLAGEVLEAAPVPAPAPAETPVAAAAPAPVHAERAAGSGRAPLAARTDASAGRSETPPAALRTVVEHTARLTGFAADQLAPELHLVDDLNLDSIKVSALVEEACASLGVPGRLEPADFANATLGELGRAIDGLVGATATPTATPTPTPTPTPTTTTTTTMTTSTTSTPPTGPIAVNVLLDLAAEITGFERATLAPTASFTDDLNLDSIKIADLVSRAEAALGVTGAIDPAAAASKTVAEIAAAIEARRPAAPGAKARAPAAPAPEPAPASWVRAFELRPVPCALVPEAGAAADDAGRTVAIQCEDEDRDLARELGERWTALGARVVVVDHAQLLHGDRTDLHRIVVVLPRAAPRGARAGELVSRAVGRLRAAAVASARQARCVGLTFVQFGGVGDGAMGSIAGSCASSFAASIHLERPHLRVRVADFHPLSDARLVAGRVLDEQRGADAYVFSHTDADGRRHRMEPRPIEPGIQPARPLAWSDRDVVVVSGGAKGITAECALAFARATKARMMLLGSSPAGDAGGEIAATLRRYADADLSAEYHQCDLADADAVRRTVLEIERRHGPVTGLVHGAGLNRPRRVEQVDEREAFGEVSPKLNGLLHLLAALEAAPLKLVAGMSSIIGVTGMAGNAWYAFSNEALHLRLRQLRAERPGVETVALAYSVWADVGMGARMGSTRHLAKMGIAAIPRDAGVAQFLHCVLRRTPSQVVIAGRLGGLDTWRRPAPASPAADRFLQDVRELEPGVELVARARLTLEDDLYLRDHYFRGVYLFPTVFGLEAMAQAVAKVLGVQALGALRIEDIQLTRPIVVGSDKGTEIQLRALVAERRSASEPVSIRVGIGTEQTAFVRDHFSATFVLEAQRPGAGAEPVALPAAPLDLDPATELYGGLLFQGPLFQRLERVHAMSSAGSTLAIRPAAGARYFSARHSPELVLGDPAARDVLLQSAQLSVKGVLLPIGIDALHLYEAPSVDRDRVVARTVMTARDAAGATCHVTAASGPEHRPVERLVGYRLKQMELDEAAPAPEDWASPGERDAGILAAAVAAAAEALGVALPERTLTFDPELSRLDRTVRRVRETPLLLDVASRSLAAHGQRLGAAPEVRWRDDGKPFIGGGAANGVDVSLSHDRTHCLCVAGHGPQGCDLEPVAPRSRAEWLRLVGGPREALLQRLVDGGDSLDDAGTRLWCAIETVTKALGAGDAELAIVERRDAAVLLSARTPRGAVRVLTLPLALTRPPRKMLALTVLAPADAARVPAPDELPASNDRLGAPPAPLAARAPSAAAPGAAPMLDAGIPVLQPELTSRFRVTFKDVTTSLRGLQFDTFADWMGRLRELAIAPVGKELVADFASGRWGMVTNHSAIRVVGRVECLDLVEGRMRVTRAYGKFGSSTDLRFEWVRVGEDGSEETFATSEMATTWVEIVGHGMVEVRPFPAYMQRLIDAYVGAGEADDAPDGTDGTEVAGRVGPRPAADPQLGEAIYLAPRAPKVEPELLRATFDTTSAESNLVGNVYYANYYHWQARVIDRLFHGVATGQSPAAPAGELTCVRSTVAHVREAMPFDRIEVAVGLKALHRRGVTLHLDYFRVAEDGQRTKLAVGEHHAIWTDAATGAPADLPAIVLSHLTGRIPAAA